MRRRRPSRWKARFRARSASSGKADPDWPTRIAQRLKQGDVNVVVVMLGTDDRRQVTLDGQRAGFRDPAWEEVYRVLVQRTVAAVRDSRKPLIWVGLPPVSGPDRRSDFSYLNDFYKEKVETADGIFVDLWEAFLSEEGKYTSYGADVDGKTPAAEDRRRPLFHVAGLPQGRLLRATEGSRAFWARGRHWSSPSPGGDANMILLSGGASP